MSDFNFALISGRLTRDPSVTYTKGDKPMCIAKYSLAIGRSNGQEGADFPNVTAFGKRGEFAEKYLKKGMHIGVSGSIQTGSYTNKDGVKVYTTDVIADRQIFLESKSASAEATQTASSGGESQKTDPMDGFMNIPDIADEELPFT